MDCFGISLAGVLSLWKSCFPSSFNFPPRSFSPRHSPASSHQLLHPRRSPSVLVLPSSSQIDEYLDKKPYSEPQPPIPMEYGPSCSNYLQSVGTYDLSCILTSFISSVLINKEPKNLLNMKALKENLNLS